MPEIMKNPLSQLTISPGHGQETRWELANVCGFQRSKQSMSSGWLSPAGDRLESSVSLRIPSQVLPVCIQRLTPLKEREELIIYLVAAKEAISAVLITEREGKQMSGYFVSRALRGPEINYTPMEKLVLALLSASRLLKRYFQAHTIVVIINQPIKQLLSNSEITGRMLKWKFELEGYDIQYRPRISIKGQILADFIVEWPEEESPDELMTEPKDYYETLDFVHKWVILEVLSYSGEEGHTMDTPYANTSQKEILPKDKKKARVVRRKASSMHTGPRSVVAKAIRTDNYCQQCIQTVETKGNAMTAKIVIDNGKPFVNNHSKTGGENYVSACVSPSVNASTNKWLGRRAKQSLGEGIKAQLEKKARIG
ncbi:reverse transcriptase domain-containing protein [Tanacetum coccineum]